MPHKRLKQLETNVAELSRFREKHTIQEIKKDKSKEWALRYGLLESIQVVIDISCHIVVHKNLGNAKTYSECIELLHTYDHIDEELKDKLIGMTGLCNILVHEYIEIDLDQLYGMLNRLDDFNQFANAVEMINRNTGK